MGGINMFCSKCGKEMSNESTFCSNCGQSIQGQTVQGQPYYPVDNRKSRLVAGLLQIFLGGCGVGRFYLGYTTIGVCQLLVTIFTCGIGYIWPLIDGILIISGNLPTDADGVPLKE